MGCLLYLHQFALLVGLSVGLLSAEVSSLADAGPGSLREALRGGSPVTFNAVLAKQTIMLSETLVIDRAVVIDASAAPGVTISGGGKTRVFEVKTGEVTIIGLTIVDGRASAAGKDGNGGGLWTHGGTVLNLKNCVFRNNVALGEGGGGIFVGWRHTTNVISCLFENNDGSIPDSERGGGAIATSSEGKLTVKGSRFINNKGGNGGGINSLLGELTVEDCAFTGNTTPTRGKGTFGYGAAIYVDGASALTNDALGGTITLRRCQFTANIGAGQGGATFLFAYPPDNVVVEACVFTKNLVMPDAKGDTLGGAIRLGNTTFVIRDSAFVENQAGKNGGGGGLWIGETSPGSVINCTFAGNGGALTGATKSPITVEHCSFVGGTGGSTQGANVTKIECLESSSTALVLGPDNVPYLKDQTTGARPALATSVATAKTPMLIAGEGGKTEKPVKPAKPAKPAETKPPAPDAAILLAADHAFPSEEEAVSLVKAHLQSELTAGRHPPVLVKVDLVNPTPVALIAMDTRGIRTMNPLGDEMQLPWKMLPPAEIYRFSKPTMINAPTAAYRGWLVLGLYHGAQSDPNFHQLLGPLWEHDLPSAKQLDEFLKKLDG